MARLGFLPILTVLLAAFSLASGVIIFARELPQRGWVAWGEQVHSSPEELSSWLSSRGRDYETWAATHPQAAAELEGRPKPPPVAVRVPPAAQGRMDRLTGALESWASAVRIEHTAALAGAAALLLLLLVARRRSEALGGAALAGARRGSRGLRLASTLLGRLIGRVAAAARAPAQHAQREHPPTEVPDASPALVASPSPPPSPETVPSPAPTAAATATPPQPERPAPEASFGPAPDAGAGDAWTDGGAWPDDDAAPEWCEITLWHGYVKSQFLAVSGRDGGATLASSPLFRRKGNVVTESPEAVAAHEALLAELAAAGWKQVASGPEWYAQEFRFEPELAGAPRAAAPQVAR